MKHVRLIVCGIAASSLSLGALAQNQPAPDAPAQRAPREGGPGMGGGFGGGRQLAPEKAKAAWEMQATGVAKRLGLNEAQTKTLVTAYIAARESQGPAVDKIRQEGMQKAQDGGGIDAMRDGMKRIEEVNTTTRETFTKALAGSLSSEQSTKAVASLGTFDRQWDRVVDVFSTFKLDAAKQQEGLNAIEDFSATTFAAQAKARAAAAQGAGQAPGQGEAPAGGERGPGAGGPEREAMRAANQEGRQKLVSALQPILTKEQLTKIEETIPGGGRGPGGGGGRRQGGGGGN